MREEGSGGCKESHVGSAGVDHSKGIAEWAEGGGSTLRGALHLRRSGEAEDEVHEVSQEAHEHQTFSWSNPLSRPSQDFLAHCSRVSLSLASLNDVNVTLFILIVALVDFLVALLCSAE